MSDSLILSLPLAAQAEIEALRDQRDFYRSLLLCEPAKLAEFLAQSLETVERMRALIRTPTRDVASFRGKLGRLQSELALLSGAMQTLELPTMLSRLQQAQGLLGALSARAQPSGNEFLPALAAIEALCSHLLIAADHCALRLGSSAEPAPPGESTATGPQIELNKALRHCAGKIAAEFGKRIELSTRGLDKLPEQWHTTVFDLIAALLRNAIEHGIESPPERQRLGKPEYGLVDILVTGDAVDGFEIAVRDDGAGIDTQGVASSAVGLGLVHPDALPSMNVAQIAGLIFQAGVSTASGGAKRGRGMKAVRDQVQQLGGRVKVASHRGRYTRCGISLPGPSEQTTAKRRA